MALQRLHKIIAKAGILSLRKAEAAILEGRVSVNGEPVSALGSQADPLRDEIRVDGKLLDTNTKVYVFAFHKPRNVICSKSDPEGRPTVMDYFKDHPELNPVGRLDFDSEGLLLMSNDGQLAYRVTHPKFNIEKTYEIRVQGIPSTEAIEKLMTGVELSDGIGKVIRIERRMSVKNQTVVGNSSEWTIAVQEGRNRFVRRMLDAIEHPVMQLKRTQVGSIELGTLATGKSRPLTEREIKSLYLLAEARLPSTQSGLGDR